MSGRKRLKKFNPVSGKSGDAQNDPLLPFVWVRFRVCERAPPLDENNRRDDQSKQNAPADYLSR